MRAGWMRGTCRCAVVVFSLVACSPSGEDRTGPASPAPPPADAPAATGAAVPEAPPPVHAPEVAGSCDPSYADVCVPPPPPDLACDDIDARAFRVVRGDPHLLDDDGDGLACESDSGSPP